MTKCGNCNKGLGPLHRGNKNIFKVEDGTLLCKACFDKLKRPPGQTTFGDIMEVKGHG